MPFRNVQIVVSILSVASGLASIITLVAELIRKRVHDSSRPTRVAIAVTVLVVSVAAGIMSLPAEPLPAEPLLTALHVDKPMTEPQAPIAASKPRETEMPVPIPKPAAAPAKPVPLSEIRVGERERTMPEVVAAADDALAILQSHFPTVRGSLRGTQSEPDVALQGLITTDLTLDVKLIDMKGVVRQAFTITSRGGGFTADASGLQARERLRDAIRQRIGKEQP